MPCSCGQHRTPQGCAGARRLQTLTDAQRRMGGYRGGKTRAAQWKRAIEARLAALEAKLEK